MKLSRDYQSGVADSLKMLFHYINGIDTATGFRASAVAQNHSKMLKDLYNQISMALVSK